MKTAFLPAWTKWLLIVPAVVLYAVLSHLVFASPAHAQIAVLFVWAPIAIVVLFVFWHTRYRWPWALVVAIATWALWTFWPLIDADVSVLYVLQYLSWQGAGAIFFGRTLTRDQTPLMVRIATAVHGPLPEYMQRYARNVTIIWTLMFIAMGIACVALYFFAARETWSVFVNLLTLPCFVALYIVEHFIRKLRYPEFADGILTGIRAYHHSIDRSESRR